MIDSLVSVLLHLPFGLLLAVVALEFFAIPRRSKTADEAVIVVLCVAGASLLLAVGIAGYLAFGEGSAAMPFGNVWIGLGVTALAGIALGLKVLCRKKGIASLDGVGSRRGRRAKGRSRGELAARASILLGYRGALAAASLALFGGILLVQSSPTAAPVADGDTGAEARDPGQVGDDPAAKRTGEVEVAAESTPSTPGPDVSVAAAEPAPVGAPVAPAEVAVAVDPRPAPEMAGDVPPEPVAIGEAAAETASPDAGAEPETTGAVASADSGMTAENGTEREPEGVAEEGEVLVAKNDPKGKTTAAMIPATPPVKPLTPPTPTPVSAPTAKSAQTFLTIVRPVLKDRCFECHGPDKQKGDLRLDTPEGIRKGGKSGPIVVVGKPEKSPIFVSVSLPPDDDDIMPPKGQPLTEPQAGYIRRWILDGAPMGDGKQWPGEDKLASMGDPDAEPLPDGVTLPDPAFLGRLRADGIEVLAVTGSGAMLEIGLTHAGREAGQMRLDQLAPIAKNIQSLDLKKTKVSDDDLTILEDMTSLTKLNLALTKVGDPSMSHIRKLEDLEYLNLYGTEVSDRSIPYLKSLKKLTKLFLWNSKVSESGVAKLKKELPKTDISVGG